MSQPALSPNIVENTWAGREGEPRPKQVVQTGGSATPCTPIQVAADGFVVVKRRDLWSRVNIHTDGFFRCRRQQRARVGGNRAWEQTCLRSSRASSLEKKYPPLVKVWGYNIYNRGYKRKKTPHTYGKLCLEKAYCEFVVETLPQILPSH